MQQIGPDEAIDRAEVMIKAPSLVVMLGSWLGFVVLGKLRMVPTVGHAGFKWCAAFFVLGFLGGWLVWSIQVPRWRLWAYRRVEDIRQLEAAAVGRMILWPPGSIWERTEIMSQAVRDELQRLRESSRVRCEQSADRTPWES